MQYCRSHTGIRKVIRYVAIRTPYRYVEGVADEQVLKTTLPHSSFGDPGCCGCLDGLVRGSLAHIACNECGAILRTVSASTLRRTLDEMAGRLKTVLLAPELTVLP